MKIFCDGLSSVINPELGFRDGMAVSGVVPSFTNFLKQCACSKIPAATFGRLRFPSSLNQAYWPAGGMPEGKWGKEVHHNFFTTSDANRAKNGN